jgi:hypothetical protein
MKNKILGWIGVVWGGFILVNFVLSLVQGSLPGGAYGLGRLLAVAIGILLLYAGVRALRAAKSGSQQES